MTMGKGKGSKWNPSACNDCLRIGAALADKCATLDGSHLSPLRISGLIHRVSLLLCSAILRFFTRLSFNHLNLVPLPIYVINPGSPLCSAKVRYKRRIRAGL